MKKTQRREDEVTRRAGLAALVVTCTVLALSHPVAGQEADPFHGALFAVELVMGNQEAIGLTSDQRDAVVAAIQRTQSEVVPWQLSLSASAERLLELVGQTRVDVEGALAEAGEALSLENRVKLEHVRLLIDIKNILTLDQQRKLEAIRELQ